MHGYYRGRARAALRQALPGVQADVRVVAIGGDAAAASVSADGNDKPVRNFQLRVIVSTGAPLNAEETMLARNAVAAAIALDEAAGDELTFRVGLAPTGTAPTVSPQDRAEPTPGRNALPAVAGTPWLYWIIGAIGLLIAGALILPRVRARTRLSATEREAMIARVRAALHPTEAEHA